MPLSAGDVIRTTVVWDLFPSGEAQNVYSLLIGGTVPGDIEDFHHEIEEYLLQLYAPILAHMSVNLSHQRVDLFNLTDGDPVIPMGRIAGLDGLNSTERLPDGVAAFVFGRTSQSRVIARKFLPPFSENNTVDGFWSAGTLTDLQEYADIWPEVITPVAAMTVQNVVWTQAEAVRGIIQGVVSPTPAYQRRRRKGRGV